MRERVGWHGNRRVEGLGCGEIIIEFGGAAAAKVGSGSTAVRMRSMLNQRFPFVLGSVVSLSLVVGGVLMARFMNLAACPLCIWQRIFYLLFALLSSIGLVGANHRAIRIVSGLLMAAAAAAGAGVAGYQVWIQRFAPMTSCAGKEPWWEAAVRVAGEQLPLLFEANGLCSDPAWKFLGLSIADWSLLAFSGLFVLAIHAALTASRARRRSGFGR
jgi:protein dithiol:quinone oxidoreductase